MAVTTTDGAGAAGAVSMLTQAARATWVAENQASGQRLETCYALFRACQDDEHAGADPSERRGYAVLDPFDVCATHVVAQFAVSAGRAERMVMLSVDLSERLPDVLAALVAGRIELRLAELLSRQMRTVDDAVIAAVQRQVIDSLLAALESGTHLGERAIKEMVDQIIAGADPDGLRRRRDDAKLGRGVSINAGSDGMAHLWGCLKSEEMALVSAHLDRRMAAYARAVDTSQVSKSTQRADALMALICGEPDTSPLAPDHAPDATSSTGAGTTRTADTGAAGAGVAGAGASGAGAGGGVPVRPQVTVITGSGADGPVVAFPRTGQASIEALVAMLGASDGASLERFDPTIGAHDDPGRRHTYRPSAALARTIRLRDGTCRHPGCTVAAEHCDIDHVIPFDHDDPACGGPTCECNHCLFCRAHHRFKTFSDWTYTLAPDGTLTITTPDGTLMRTRPTGPLATHRRTTTNTTETTEQAHQVAEYRAEQHEEEQARWQRQQRRTQAHTRTDDNGQTEPVAEPTARHRRAQRTRAERRLVTQAHEAARAEAARRAAAARARAEKIRADNEAARAKREQQEQHEAREAEHEPTTNDTDTTNNADTADNASAASTEPTRDTADNADTASTASTEPNTADRLPDLPYPTGPVSKIEQLLDELLHPIPF